MIAAAVLCIEGEFTIYRASEMAATLRDAFAALSAGDALDIDLSGVTEMDCAGIQLLLASARTAAAGGCALRLAGTSAVVDEALATLHLGDRFAGRCTA
jgi:anti-anti-sigma factor